MSEQRRILSAEEIARFEGKERTHFLNPNAVRVNTSLGDACGLTGLGIHRIELSPGRESSALHVHHEEDEAIYVLQGTGTVRLDDSAYAVAPGTLIAHPAGSEAHKLVNTGDTPLVCLVIGERRSHDICDYPRAGRRMYRHRGSDDVVAHNAIGAKR